MKIKNFFDKSLVSALYHTQTHFQFQLAKLLKQIDLPYVEALVLVGLFFDSDEPRNDSASDSIGPGRIANALKLKKARTSQALSKLAERGYLRREIHSRDSRKIKLRLLPSGIKKATQIIKAFDAFEANIEKHLGTAKCAALQKDLLKLAEIFEK